MGGYFMRLRFWRVVGISKVGSGVRGIWYREG